MNNPSQAKQAMSSSSTTNTQEHKTRRRTRFGCRNCKLRKLKCDESKPHCQRCSSFGILCNFISNVSDLQPIVSDTGNPFILSEKAEPHPPITSAVWTADRSTSFQLDAKSQDFITRYLGLSLITQNDPSMMSVNRKLLELAFAHPLLMHASLAVAFAYDRHLNSSSGSRRSLEECYHSSQSIALFNKRLSSPIDAKDKDPIWGTAAALAMLSFSSLDSCVPEESWPLKSKSPGYSDLAWLDMINGKMSLWNTIDPLRPESIFHVMAASFTDMFSPLPTMGVDGIPESLVNMCLLNDSSTAENNAYFSAAHAISRLIGLPDYEITAGQVQLFASSIHGPYRMLLQEKDPVALMLLYMWYRKAGRCIWWIDLRARVECPAICTYLQLYHSKDDRVKHFLSERIGDGECAPGSEGRLETDLIMCSFRV
ncbi:hypothetical protein N7456_000146 [Penicillium angulare]|uniref:Zn(2)-C6 fungal-type domain-containing protein n=1 Tax=Penicillium angulare TaxID=116970 RepID=A0A9W9GBH4_9EURO|nr:hypothetical protein N7456_000146 [Penicillium angulare]